MTSRSPGAQRSTPARDEEIARLIARLTMEHFLRTLQGLVEMMPNEDVLTMVVHRAILTANLSHLDVDPAQRVYAGLDSPPPDEVRRPVSIRGIATSLSLPFETVRRRVLRLQELQLCRQVKGGWIVPAVYVQGPAATTAMLGNLANTRRLLRRLEAAGLRLAD